MHAWSGGRGNARHWVCNWGATTTHTLWARRIALVCARDKMPIPRTFPLRPCNSDLPHFSRKHQHRPPAESTIVEIVIHRSDQVVSNSASASRLPIGKPSYPSLPIHIYIGLTADNSRFLTSRLLPLSPSLVPISTYRRIIKPSVRGQQPTTFLGLSSPGSG
jgi:hypothetical protein